MQSGPLNAHYQFKKNYKLFLNQLKSINSTIQNHIRIYTNQFKLQLTNQFHAHYSNIMNTILIFHSGQINCSAIHNELISKALNSIFGRA